MTVSVALVPEIAALIAAAAPVAIGVSGGKDSQAAAMATIEYLDSVQHRGSRVLIHSDLGVVEWKESLPVCRTLAEHLGIELIVVRRKAGDLMDRWESRWQSSGPQTRSGTRCWLFGSDQAARSDTCLAC